VAITLQQLADQIDAQFVPSDTRPLTPDHPITGCNTLENAGADEVSFLANTKYAEQLQATQAGAVVVAPDVDASHLNRLIAQDPYHAFRNAMVALHGFRQHPDQDSPVSSQASVHPDATLGANVTVHPFAVISQGVTVGDNTVIYPHVFIGPDAQIGADCTLYPSVTVYDRCVLGDRVTLHAGCVIGQDGFGYATHNGSHHKIPQSGNTVIEDDVEMGANCSVDRATMGSTVIGAGTKFSNTVTIGHGTKIGKHNLYVAGVGVAGSCTVGDYVVMGGQVGVANHIKIGSMVKIAATAGVMNDIPDNTDMLGTPALPINEGKRVVLHMLKLPELAAKVKNLEKAMKRMGEG
jgi:UDP-3-O-[3-hydroxymyristoyl] glucosamine N-acyltransferase